MLTPNVPTTAFLCESGACVEVTWLPDIQRVRVRDTKNTAGPYLFFTREEWDTFQVGIRAGQFNLEPEPGTI